MSTSCFGCCSTRAGVSCIFVFNIFWITLIVMFDFINRLHGYYQFAETTSFERTTSQSSSPNLEMFLDYIFIVKLGWTLMEFYLNISLKQSTYTVSPERIYAWLVIYYFNLGAVIFYETGIFFNKMFYPKPEYHLTNFVEITIYVVEIYVIQSYYKQQKLAVVGDFVHLKWKYIPSTEMRSDKTTEQTTKADNPVVPTQDESGYIPIFVKDLRNTNS